MNKSVREQVQEAEEAKCEWCNHPREVHEVVEEGEGSDHCHFFENSNKNETCNCSCFSRAD